MKGTRVKGLGGFILALGYKGELIKKKHGVSQTVEWQRKEERMRGLDV
jgi:hypothetical protein